MIARAAFAAALVLAGRALADDAPPSSLDDAGFADLDTSPVALDEGPRSTTIAFTWRADSAVWTERLGDHGFAKLRFTGDPRVETRRGNFRFVAGVRAEWDAAYRYRRDDYDRSTIDVYEWVVRPGETYLAWADDHLELATGAQVVAWGAGESLAVVDLLGPRDLREPGLTSIDDARVPVWTTRASVFGRGVRGELVLVHQAHFRLVPPPLGTFSPIREALLRDPELVASGIADLLATRDLEWDQWPRSVRRESQAVGVRVVADRGPFTIGGYAAALLDPQGVARLPDAAEFANDRVAIPLEHRRFGMLATSLAFTRGPIELHGEVALDLARPVNVLSDDPIALLVDRRTLVRWLFGGRVTNPRGGVLSLEYAQGTLHEPGRRAEADPLVPTSVATLVARYEHAFARDRLRFAAMAAGTGQRLGGGAFGRAELTYHPRDGLGITAGYAVYLPTDEPSPIRGFDRHDRAMLGLRWDEAFSVGRPQR